MLIGCVLLCVIPLILLVVSKIFLKKRRNVCIVVLGDIGRSPRMQYHAISFAKEGFTVDIIGYPGSSPLNEITENSLIRIHYLSVPPELRDKLPVILCYILKTLWQTVTLLCILFGKCSPSRLLLQNPPSIPTIPVCWFYSIVVNCQFTIDWHNYGYTLMALNLKQGHLLVKIAKFVERYFGSKAQNNLCVSKAMKLDLKENWGIEAMVLYDRPPDQFSPLSLTEKHEFLLRLSKTYDAFKGPDEGSTIFTSNLSSNRPGLVVSSTSWTEDEDFSILLNALQEYEVAVKQDNLGLPDLICVITGKGPLKHFYTSIIQQKNWQHVTIITPWLESEDYPKMLASADLGISLHTSSSGLDLPMKVVDMFGCRLPVCAYNFKCLSELVRHNENSLVFSNEKELAAQLQSWFQNFPNNAVQQKLDEKFRRELNNYREERWHANWLNNALPSFIER